MNAHRERAQGQPAGERIARLKLRVFAKLGVKGYRRTSDSDCVASGAASGVEHSWTTMSVSRRVQPGGPLGGCESQANRRITFLLMAMMIFELGQREFVGRCVCGGSGRRLTAIGWAAPHISSTFSHPQACRARPDTPSKSSDWYLLPTGLSFWEEFSCGCECGGSAGWAIVRVRAVGVCSPSVTVSVRLEVHDKPALCVCQLVPLERGSAKGPYGNLVRQLRDQYQFVFTVWTNLRTSAAASEGFGQWSVAALGLTGGARCG